MCSDIKIRKKVLAEQLWSRKYLAGKNYKHLKDNEP